MSHLDTLITRHLKELSGAEFKLAVYQYRRLQRRAEVMDTIDSLANATGLSWRHTQTALRSLALSRDAMTAACFECAPKSL